MVSGASPSDAGAAVAGAANETAQVTEAAFPQNQLFQLEQELRKAESLVDQLQSERSHLGATTIQACLRMWKLQCLYYKAYIVVVKLESWWRMYKARREYKSAIAAHVKLESWWHAP